MRKSKPNKMKLNNQGSALITVIIVIAFICVLTTLLLYLSVMNYQMKATDYRTKVSFYGAEVPLEELRVHLAADMAYAGEKAYKSVMTQFGSLEEEALRVAEYENIIETEIYTLWDERTTNPVAIGEDWCYAINSVLDPHMNSADTSIPHIYHVISGDSDTVTCTNPSCKYVYHIILEDMGGAERLENIEMDITGDGVVDHCIALRGIKVSYTENGFSSVISTDFCMNMPQYDWSVDAYSPAWAEGTSNLDRTGVDYEKCVVFLNYFKQ